MYMQITPSIDFPEPLYLSACTRVNPGDASVMPPASMPGYGKQGTLGDAAVVEIPDSP